MRPTLIRVEADELTYSLHVILRFELELALIDGSLDVGDLPQVWAQKFRDMLGIDVPDDVRGVLQDIHWSEGIIGYFPTYAIGNVLAAQLWRVANADLPEPGRRSARRRVRRAARLAGREGPPSRPPAEPAGADRAGRRWPA